MTTKTKIVITSMLLAAILIGGTSFMNSATALPAHVEDNQKGENEIAFTKSSSVEIRDHNENNPELPTPHTDGQLKAFEKMAEKRPEVKKLLGDNFEYKSSGKYGSDKDQKSQIDFFTDDGQNIVSISFDHGKIVSVEKYEAVQWSTLGFAIDYYSGSQSLSGLQMRADVPDYDHDSGAWTAMLVNAQKDGSNLANVCNSSNAPDDYWAQAGMQFDTNDVRIGWTDTLSSCSPTFLTNFSFNTGDEIKFRIYIDDDDDEWYVWIDNVDDGAGAFVTDPRDVDDSSVLDTSSRHTSVWFESQNSSWNWEDGFNGNPDVNSAHYQKASNGNWYYWDGETQIDYACSLGAWIDGDDLMDGTFVGSPHDVTFDVSEIEYYCD